MKTLDKIYSIFLVCFLAIFTIACEKEEITPAPLYDSNPGINSLNVSIAIDKNTYKENERIVTSLSFDDMSKIANVDVFIYNGDGTFDSKACSYSKKPGVPPLKVGSYPTAPSHQGNYYVVFRIAFFVSITSNEEMFPRNIAVPFTVK